MAQTICYPLWFDTHHGVLSGEEGGHITDDELSPPLPPTHVLAFRFSWANTCFLEHVQ